MLNSQTHVAIFLRCLFGGGIERWWEIVCCVYLMVSWHALARDETHKNQPKQSAPKSNIGPEAYAQDDSSYFTMARDKQEKTDTETQKISPKFNIEPEIYRHHDWWDKYSRKINYTFI